MPIEQMRGGCNAAGKINTIEKKTLELEKGKRGMEQRIAKAKYYKSGIKMICDVA